MRSDDDKAAQEERAKRIRQQIGKFTQKDDAGKASEAASDTHEEKNPRDFVERRMRELAEEERKRAAEREKNP